jgi:hypothetical protein
MRIIAPVRLDELGGLPNHPQPTSMADLRLRFFPNADRRFHHAGAWTQKSQRIVLLMASDTRALLVNRTTLES